ncbi:TPA: 7-cyano-7-deazaguanine synthase QueC [Candidatus Avigastranaerophilus faecigallinarum]|nr:7-cyano-7-deazaguanine synthase QueC [Candidatus Avigastranaerophilus faecigallinarum]
MNKAIVLLSGGLDSVVSLAVIKDKCSEIMGITFNYGQKSYLAEKKAAELISKYYKIEHKVIDLDWLSIISTSSLTTKDTIPYISKDNLDNISVAQNTAKSVWVPNRNGLFVNIAACFAEAYNFDTIIIGANKEEGATFKDNTIEFINAINTSLENSTNSKIELVAPLINMTKEEIVNIAIQKNVPLELIHSCYISEEKHCGFCESCQRLKRALELNKRTDIIEKIFEQDS